MTRDAGGKGFVLGIDATRNRSGGAKVHLIGILRDSDPRRFGIEQVHVWSYRALLDALPDHDWLVKHHSKELERSLIHQIWWQFRCMAAEVRKAGCDILLNTDAGTVGRFAPSVVMSRDMLSYERGEMRRYGFSKAWARLFALRYVQAISMRRAHSVIFLTRYAAKTIQETIGSLPNTTVIPHGVSESFRCSGQTAPWPVDPDQPIECLYVSNAAPYKHQWRVIRALALLRERGYKVRLRLAGGGSGVAKQMMDDEISRRDPQRAWVETIGAVSHEQIPALLKRAHLFVFASSCENMPNTLVEAMATGLPIACSDRGPMPEILKDAGTYFDPENEVAIAAAIAVLLDDAELRRQVAARAFRYAADYSWKRCGEETWAYLYANACGAVNGQWLGRPSRADN